MKMKMAKTDSQEFRLIQDNDGHWYIVPADEVEIFYHWVDAMEGRRHMPANFHPIQVDGPHTVVFKEWREEP